MTPAFGGVLAIVVLADWWTHSVRRISSPSQLIIDGLE